MINTRGFKFPTQTLLKDRIFWKKLLENKEMDFKNGAINIQTAGYYCACMVFTTLVLPILSICIRNEYEKHKNFMNFKLHNRPKSQILLHKKNSPQDFVRMTLVPPVHMYEMFWRSAIAKMIGWSKKTKQRRYNFRKLYKKADYSIMHKDYVQCTYLVTTYPYLIIPAIFYLLSKKDSRGLIRK